MEERSEKISIFVAALIPIVGFAVPKEQFHINCKVHESNQFYQVKVDYDPTIGNFGRLVVTVDTGNNVSLAEHLQSNLAKVGIDLENKGFGKIVRSYFPITNQDIKFTADPLNLEIFFIRAELAVFDEDGQLLKKFIKYPPYIVDIKKTAEKDGYDTVLFLGELPGNDLEPGLAHFNFAKHCKLLK